MSLHGATPTDVHTNRSGLHGATPTHVHTNRSGHHGATPTDDHTRTKSRRHNLRESTEVSIYCEHSRVHLDPRVEDGHGCQHTTIAVRFTVALKEHDRDVLLLLSEVKHEGHKVEEGAGRL